MADPISIASGIVGLVSFGIQASQALYTTLQSLKNYTKTIRELKQQLEALQNVLQGLQKAADDGLISEFESIKLPLYCCAKACKEFEGIIRKCTENSSDTHRSLRDWAKLRYMGSDINGFCDQLATYKSTIQVALGGINLRTSAVTMSCLQEYRDMVRDTKADLEEHLCRIDEQLQDIVPPASQVKDADELRRMQEEKNSTLNCLHICAQVSTYIEQYQATAIQNLSTSSDGTQDLTIRLPWDSGNSGQVTAIALSECSEKIKNTTTELQKRLGFIHDRLNSASAMDPSTIEEERRSIQRCLDICDEAALEAEKARTNTFVDVTVAEDSRQVVVSTVGDLISAKRVTAGARSLQLAGQMSDSSLQHILHAGVRDINEASDPGDVENKSSKFENRHGAGRNLGSRRSAKWMENKP